MRNGLVVSPGVAVGTAYCIHEVYFDPHAPKLKDVEVKAELDRFERAMDRTHADLHALYVKVKSQVGDEDAEIFRAHEDILRDPTIVSKVREYITVQRLPAQTALHDALNEYTSEFARARDEYLKERLADVRDVIIRLSGHLSDVLQPGSPALAGPLIVVADDLLPSHVVALGDREVSGIVTQRGGQTGHAAILARSRGIPAVSGVRGILQDAQNGDLIVVDGREGVVIVNPDAESTAAYRKLEREFIHLKGELAANHDKPAVMADGTRLDLLANINGESDARAACAMGAGGVGLFRTEYLFLTHPSVPDEEEQVDAYRRVVDASPNQRVTIRTLDIGGDKTIPYLGVRNESNPFLGWRSIRLSFEHPEFFVTQIRAVLRAAASDGETKRRVQLMFPMITTLEELRAVRRMVRRARKQLEEAGLPHGNIAIGMMVEVPAAAITIDAFLEVADFVSIGSNDLVQYLMAADRDNPKVSHLCQPLSPPVLRVLSQVISTCRNANTPVTLCGEMAGQPRSFLLLLGMGLRMFSMSPSFVPTIKDMASRITVEQAEAAFHQAMRYNTAKQIQDYAAQRVHELCPNLDLLSNS